MKTDVLAQMDAFGSERPLRALVAGLPAGLDIVVKAGVGDFLPLAAGHESVAGIYMNKQHMHLLLDPVHAKALSNVPGCRLVRVNGTTGYVKVPAAVADVSHAAVAPYVESAMLRSAGRLGAGAPRVDLVTDQEESAASDEATGGPFGAHFQQPCVVFRISRLWYPGMPDDELYEATRGWWRMGPKREHVHYAIAVAEGVIRAVYVVDEWMARRFEDDGVTPFPGNSTRWGFVGEPDDDHPDLIGLDVRHLFPMGAQNPVTYFNLDQAAPAPASISTTAPPPVERLAELRRIVRRLQDNPVLVMSLHSKELFHSNLLGWIVERHPEAAAQALRPWLKPDPLRTVLDVRREKHHLDLIIELPGFAPLVIENKVFSLPDEGQLQGYARKNIPRAKAGGGTQVLLSLLDPGWPDRTFEEWAWAPWPDVVLRIAAQPEMSSGDFFDVQLVRYWIELVQDLDTVGRVVAPVDDGVPLQLDADTLVLLAEVRLADPMQKFRTFAVRTLILQRLMSAGVVVDEVESGFGSGGPLLSVKVEAADGTSVGWQLQGAQWRRFIIVPPHLRGRTASSRQARSAWVEQHHASWFRFDAEQALGPWAPAPSAEHKHFAPDFVYDYVKVGGLPVHTLLELADRVSADAVAYRDAWSGQLSSDLGDAQPSAGR